MHTTRDNVVLHTLREQCAAVLVRPAAARDSLLSKGWTWKEHGVEVAACGAGLIHEITYCLQPPEEWVGECVAELCAVLQCHRDSMLSVYVSHIADLPRLACAVLRTCAEAEVAPPKLHAIIYWLLVSHYANGLCADMHKYLRHMLGTSTCPPRGKWAQHAEWLRSAANSDCMKRLLTSSIPGACRVAQHWAAITDEHELLRPHLSAMSNRVRTTLARFAARHGAVRVVKSLLMHACERRALPLLALEAASGGCEELYQWLACLARENVSEWKRSLGMACAAARAGDMSTLSSMVSVGWPEKAVRDVQDAARPDPVSQAVLGQHREVLRWLVERFPEKARTLDLCTVAGETGNEEWVREVCEVGLGWGKEGVVAAAVAAGMPESGVQRLLSAGFPVTSRAVCAMLQHGHTEVLAFLRARGLVLPADAGTIAARAGHWNLLDPRAIPAWTRESRSLYAEAAAQGCLWAMQHIAKGSGTLPPPRLCSTTAAKHGRLRMLRWLHAQDALDTDAVYEAACQRCDFILLEWVYEVCPRWPALAWAWLASACAWDMLDWAVRRGCCWPSTLVLPATATATATPHAELRRILESPTDIEGEQEELLRAWRNEARQALLPPSSASDSVNAADSAGAVPMVVRASVRTQPQSASGDVGWGCVIA